jgi:S-disulfanyl-L-cysteine oxidoreductase SoxD
MFNSLDFLQAFNTGDFERRGREGFAKSAEEDKEKMKTKNTKNTKGYFKFSLTFSKSTLITNFLVLNKPLNSFLYSFGIFFSAPFAQPSRPLRSKTPIYTLALLLTLPQIATAQTKFEGIGKTATPNEVKAWDIDVRPDFKGLPKGQGSVTQGEKIWEAQCASCHGSFGESNEVFTPLAGYTTAKDVEKGKVASLQLDGAAPTRTTMMKVSQLSTLWDYINRAMPWTAPKSLKPDEVYAVTAYMLNLGNVVPADFTLSDKNMADTQKKLPNRLGKTTAHAMWPNNELGGNAKPDVQGSACQANCATSPAVASLIPDYARDAHGNLADQSRKLGGSRGASTVKTSAVTNNAQNSAVAQVSTAQVATNSVAPAASTGGGSGVGVSTADVMPTLQKYACVACHGMDTKLVGPSFKDIVAKQGARADAQAYLAGKIKAGGSGVYGAIPMPAQSLGDAEAQQLARWLVQGISK